MLLRRERGGGDPVNLLLPATTALALTALGLALAPGAAASSACPLHFVKDGDHYTWALAADARSAGTLDVTTGGGFGIPETPSADPKPFQIEVRPNPALPDVPVHFAKGTWKERLHIVADYTPGVPHPNPPPLGARDAGSPTFWVEVEASAAGARYALDDEPQLLRDGSVPGPLDGSYHFDRVVDLGSYYDRAANASLRDVGLAFRFDGVGGLGPQDTIRFHFQLDAPSGVDAPFDCPASAPVLAAQDGTSMAAAPATQASEAPLVVTAAFGAVGLALFRLGRLL